MGHIKEGFTRVYDQVDRNRSLYTSDSIADQSQNQTIGNEMTHLIPGYMAPMQTPKTKEHHHQSEMVQNNIHT